MTILVLLRLFSSLTKMMLIMLLRDFPKLCRMRKIVVFLPLNQIMGVSSKMKDLTNFEEPLELSTSFSAPRTPQQKGVMERKNLSLEELSRTLLNETDLPK